MSGLDEKIEKRDRRHEASDGLIPRSIRYLYDAIETQSSTKYTLKASYCEIYNEQVRHQVLCLCYNSSTGLRLAQPGLGHAQHSLERPQRVLRAGTIGYITYSLRGTNVD